MKPLITVEALIQAPIEKIWSYWNEPDHITHWYFASDDWCAPWAKNDLQVGGKLIIRMEAKDKSIGFDLEGTYSYIEQFKEIEYTLGDRKITVSFIPEETGYRIVETFEAEDENPLEMQKNGWQTILNNFKKYVDQSVATS